ncbi:MAG: general secretion pathway protein GspD [Azoarcus sp.]|jgi:general secretion pathway protein D|nr:general secretion pathway protein GspD [Azoarcus sp.]
MPTKFALFLVVIPALLSGCAQWPQAREPAREGGHIRAGETHKRAQAVPKTPDTSGISRQIGEGEIAHAPEAVPVPLPLPIPNQAAAPVYSLDVRLAPVEQVLSALARDQRIGLELHPGVGGLVSLSVFNLPLPQLIESLCLQAGLRCEFDGRRLAVMPDAPFLQAYRVDYVNLSRDMNGAVATSTQIATSSSAVDPKGGSVPSGGNASLTQIATKGANHFWETLENNIRTLLKEHERLVRKPSCEALRTRAGGAEAPCASTEDAAFVVSNRETGVLMVFASASQHRKVAEFIQLVQGAARQQVMVEATIVEVTLSDGYRQGIDWSRLTLPTMRLNPRGANDNSAALPSFSYLSGTLDVQLDWLETFGTVKVLSSPKLSVLNNQTALLKVVEEVVYFQVEASTTEYGGTSDREKVTATTRAQSVSVGLVMALTPQIGRDGEIILGVRPTISSISGYKDDPNPTLGNIPNRVPQIRTREMESVLRLADGEVAVLGGLMEDKLGTDTGRIPLLGAIPLLGELFTRRDNSLHRTELVIFLRPRLIKDIGNDYAPERGLLPDTAFLRHNAP